MKANTAEKLGAEPLNPYAAPTEGDAPVPQNDPGGELASPWTRLGAQLFDNLFVGLAAGPGAILGAIIGASLQRADEPKSQTGTFAVALAVLSALLFYLYNCHLVARDGQSLGKRLCDVRIVIENGEPPGYWRGVVLRSWVLLPLRVIPGLGYLVGLVDSLMIFGEGRRCLHDRIANTRVLKD